jgi:hypothetical protein
MGVSEEQLNSPPLSTHVSPAIKTLISQAKNIVQTVKESVITDDIFQQALTLYQQVQSITDPDLLKYDVLGLPKTVLTHFHDVHVTQEILQKRWEEDRTKRKQFVIFRRQPKLVLSDHQVFGNNCKFAWDFVDYLKIPRPGSSNAMSTLLLAPSLNVYFDRIFLKDMFIELLANGENPKTYKEVYANISDRYRKNYVENLLNFLIKES